jgi:ABC-type sugar transport system ATPase subunit
MTALDQSQSHSPQHSHSNEIENRLTKLEIEGSHHGAKLTLHERAILGIAGALYVVAQEKFPLIAGAIRGLLIP